ncbi:MAG: diphosphomevalonate decarboxylase [Salinivirgaceae bacterium]|nr:MAG: diphosphomevalonate decarboxylase [Salinivirgaceae bacterium]
MDGFQNITVNSNKSEMNGTVEWRSPSNIALIKYWGKSGDQIPMNPSISMTLKYAFTQTEIEWSPRENSNEKVFDFYLSGDKVSSGFESKVKALIGRFALKYPVLNKLFFTIKSLNTFPHSTGIASSASGMSALALALLSVVKETSDFGGNYDDFTKEASYFSRLGSGSACRSLYGPYAIWGSGTSGIGNDEYAVPFHPHNDFLRIFDSILIFSKKPKKVGSTLGHSLMNDHPYRNGRIEQVHKNMERLLPAMEQGDFDTWQQVVENEAMSLHGLMMASSTPVMLLAPETIRFLNDLEDFRTGKGLKVAYTIDAGPNVHLLYALEHREIIQDFISNWVMDSKLNMDVIDDETGMGPKQLFE